MTILGCMVRVGGVDACWIFFYWTRNAWFLAVTDFVLTVGGLGDWRTDGCHITGVFRNFTTVHCSHLSIFAIIEVILQIMVSALVSQKNNEETYFFLIYDLDLINFEMFIHEKLLFSHIFLKFNVWVLVVMIIFEVFFCHCKILNKKDTQK